MRIRLLRPVRTVTQQLSLHGKKWIVAVPTTRSIDPQQSS